MRRTLRLLLAVVLLSIGLVTASGGGPAGAAADHSVFAVDTANNLVRFDRATPGTIDASTAITGLGVGETVVGIDFRPADQALYAVGSSSRFYRLDTATGAATPIGAAGSFTLSGASFGVDFNPVPDRVRVVSEANQNLRLNPNNGALSGTDVNLNPGDPNVVGAAYTNSFPGATTTTLYTIDSTTDQLNIQNPPNNGTQVAVGALGVDTSDLVGFDITPANAAFATLTVGGTSAFYSLNLATGAATLTGTIGGGNNIVAMAMPLTFMAVPDSYTTTQGQALTVGAPGVRTNDLGGTAAAQVTGPANGALGFNADGSFVYTPNASFSGIDSFTYQLSDPPDLSSNVVTVRLVVKGGDAYAVDTLNNLLRFDRVNPGTIDASVPLTGLVAGDTIAGIDFRPADGLLYALGTSSRLYQVDTTTGAATLVGPAGAFTLDGTSFGFDFNPVPDRVRVVSEANQNLRLNPNNGALSGNDVNLNPGDPSVVGAAYTNSFPGATATTLYTIDSTTDQLNIQNPPNNGTQVPVGPLGVDTSSAVGFDITPDNKAYAALSSSLYTIDLTTGAASLVGSIPGSGIVALALPFPMHANDDNFATSQDTPLNVVAPGLRANDSGGTGTAVVSAPANGIVLLNGDGSFQYTPSAGFSGNDSFTYRLTDGAVLSNVATVLIAVAPGPPATTTTTTTSTTSTTGSTSTTTTSSTTVPDSTTTTTAVAVAAAPGGGSPAVSPATATGTLPVTGGAFGLLVVIALGLIAGGTVLVAHRKLAGR